MSEEGAPTPMGVEGIPPRDTVVTFTTQFLSYYTGESAAFTEEEAQALVDRGVATAGAASDLAPVNTAVPYAAQAGDALFCTMGEWVGEPSAYAYQWQSDGADIGAGENPYIVTLADVGHTFACVVTATNANGSTAAPPSNGVVVADPVGAGA